MLSFLVWVLEPHPSALRHVAGGRDDEIELDMDLRKTLWALHELCVNSERGKTGRQRKGGRSGTPGVARGASQGPMANQTEVCVHQLAMCVSILLVRVAVGVDELAEQTTVSEVF